MKITTRRQLIQGIAARWLSRYAPFSKWHGKEEIYKKLVLLDGDTATCEDVNSAIGNSSWTDLRCDECHKEVDAVIQVGEELDYDSATCSLCRDCVEAALGEISKV